MSVNCATFRYLSVCSGIEAGHIIASDEIRLAARRLLAQAEMLDEVET